jgi:hypothetical protein
MLPTSQLAQASIAQLTVNQALAAFLEAARPEGRSGQTKAVKYRMLSQGF